MSVVNNYNLRGIASDVTLGKRGGRLIFSEGVFKLTGNDGVTVNRVKVADGVDLDDAVSLGQVTGLVDGINTEIGDLELLTTTEKTNLVDAINEVNAAIGDSIGELGTMSQQDSDAVSITGGSISGVTLAVDTISESTEDVGVTVDGVLLKDGNVTATDVVINGNLTVLGDTTTLNVSTLEVEDNIITLNKGEVGAGVTLGSAGFEIDRGSETGVRIVWNEAEDAFRVETATGELVTLKALFDIIVDGSQGGFGVDISGYAADSLVFADGSELVKGTENQVLTVTATGVEYKTQDALRNDTTGKVAVDVTGATSATGEYLEIVTETDKVFLTAKNEAGTGDVDLYIQGQGNGDVIIAANASNQGLIIGETGTSLTVAGGGASGADAGDLILKGGDGVDTFASGDLILQGGTGGATEGIVIIRDSAGNEVASFTGGTENAVDYVDFNNGVGSAEIKAAGDSDDVDLVLIPKGTGFVLAPTDYDLSTAPDEAFITKGYVSAAVGEVANNVDPLVKRAAFTADSTNTSFAVGTLSNVDGKSYYVSRVTLHVSTELTGSAIAQMVVSDGVTTLATAEESDVLAGTYIIDLPFVTASAGGSTFTVEFQNDTNVAVAPTAGSVVAVVEYKIV